MLLYGAPVIPWGNDAFVFRQINIGEVVGIGQGQLDGDGGEQVAGLILELSVEFVQALERRGAFCQANMQDRAATSR